MILKTIHELCFENNDIYQIESCADKIIVNEDYYGVKILDLSLNTIKTIPFMEKLVIFSILAFSFCFSYFVYIPNVELVVAEGILK